MSYDFLTTGGKRGRVGYHSWDISLAQAYRNEFIIVSIVL